MGRRKLIRKKTAGFDSFVLLMVGVVGLVFAFVYAVVNIIRSLLKIRRKAVADKKILDISNQIAIDQDLTLARLLIEKVDNLLTFEEVLKWDEEASVVVERLLGRKDDEVAYQLADKLQEIIDLSPASLLERKELLAELGREKKDLQMLKREINSNMNEIRVDIRQKSARAPYSLSGLLGMTGLQRQQLPYKREQALAPLENKKDWLDSQIFNLDKKIIWVKKFADASDEA